MNILPRDGECGSLQSVNRLPPAMLALCILGLSGCCNTKTALVMRSMCCKDKCCEEKCIGDKCPCGKCPSETKVKLATALIPI